MGNDSTYFNLDRIHGYPEKVESSERLSHDNVKV